MGIKKMCTWGSSCSSLLGVSVEPKIRLFVFLSFAQKVHFVTRWLFHWLQIKQIGVATNEYFCSWPASSYTLGCIGVKSIVYIIVATSEIPIVFKSCKYYYTISELQPPESVIRLGNVRDFLKIIINYMLLIEILNASFHQRILHSSILKPLLSD